MNEKEFEHIAPQLRRRAIAAARSCGLDSDEAEDVAQDVLLKLWSLREDIASNVAAGPQRTTSERMAAFAYVAARNLSLDCMRKRHTVPITDRPVIDERNAQPDVVLENAENERWFESKCRLLPSTEYRVLNRWNGVATKKLLLFLVLASPLCRHFCREREGNCLRR